MILIARMTHDAPLYIVHLTNGLALDFIRAARECGQRNLYAETCPQYLLLDESCYERRLVRRRQGCMSGADKPACQC
jgi:dihydropyrimidinase